MRQILKDGFAAVEVVEASEGAEAIARAQGEEWDLVLLDVSMPGRGGLDALIEIKRARSKLPVLVVSMHSEAQYGARALSAGAVGYLTKDKAPEELLVAVRKALTGGRYISPLLAEKLAVDLGTGGPAMLHERLSQREFDVLRLIGRGMSLKESASELALSPKTISTYRVRLMEKMGMWTEGELMRYAIDWGLVA
jgi:DNA-binding NarL/FixJ family response regulator